MIYHREKKVVLIVDDVRDALRKLPRQSVHTCITSPPYWNLRNNETKPVYWEDGWYGELGLEPTPEQYVTHLTEVFSCLWRVLRDDGTLWINLGSSYSGSGKGTWDKNLAKETYVPRNGDIPGAGKCPDGYRPKELITIPWMVKDALKNQGWLFRRDVIWEKKNAKPENVWDRPISAHEYVLLFTKSEHYYYDAFAIRQGSQDGHGRLARSVWHINTEGYKGAHFSVFPLALVEPCIKASTSRMGCCSKCGKPWKRILKVVGEIQRRWSKNNHPESPYKKQSSMKKIYETVGWEKTCHCQSMVVPCTTLDIFGGRGTVAKCSKSLGRRSIYIDVKPEYAELAKEFINA